MIKVNKDIIDDELCPICEERPVEIDDMGFFGCRDCYNKLPSETRIGAREKSFDQDATGQDRENFENPE